MQKFLCLYDFILTIVFCFLLTNFLFANNPSYHKIKKGDTLIKIANQYKISISELMRINKLNNKSKINSGQKLFLPGSQTFTQNNQMHIIGKKDTLFGISKHYNVSIEEIISLNKINKNKIFAGQKIVIPIKGNKQKINLSDTNYKLIWPVKGKIISLFGMQNQIPHKGIDIGASAGTPVKASLDGEIKYIGYFHRLKNFIIIKHDDMLSTVYGNLDEIIVTVEQKILQGETIGTVADEENAPSPFVHFEVRYYVEARNPLKFLKR